MALVVSKAHKKIHRLTRILNFIHLKWFETTHKAAQICKVMRHCWQFMIYVRTTTNFHHVKNLKRL